MIKENFEKWSLLLTKLIEKSIEDKYLKIYKTDEIIICPINFDIIQYPVITICNHIFEKECIIRWIKDNKTCPLCRKRFGDYLD